MWEIVDGKPFHCGMMARSLRDEHRHAIMADTASIHRELRAAFDGSHYKKSLIVDGELLAVGGVMGSVLGFSGVVWLAMTNRAKQYKLLTVRLARQTLEELLAVHPTLNAGILFGDETSRKFAEFLGFERVESDVQGAGGGYALRYALTRTKNGDD